MVIAGLLCGHEERLFGAVSLSTYDNFCEKKSYLGNQQQLRKSAIRLLTRDLRQPRRPTRTRQEAAPLVDDAQTGRNTARGRDRRQADNRRCRVIRWIVRDTADMARIIRALGA